MNDTAWKQVARKEDLKEGIPYPVTVDKAKIFLILLEDAIHALRCRCPHYGAPLNEGLISGGHVTCPWHHARFEITTGKLTMPPSLDDLRRYQVKIENGDVYIGGPEPAIPADRRVASGVDGRVFTILGAGAAGNAAAEMLRREGFSGRILLITAENRLPYDRPNLSKGFLTGEASADWLPLRSEKFYEERNIELLRGRQVTKLKPADRLLVFSDGEELKFDRALLATGATPRAIPLPGNDLPNVFLLRTMDDAERILRAVEKARRAVVLGSSFMGLEVAASLRERGMEVDLVAPEEIPMIKIFGDRIGRWFQRMHEKQGVRFHLGIMPSRIDKTGDILRVSLSDGSTLEGDLVIGGLGVTPAVGYLEGTGLVQGGAVPVDGCLQTGVSGIFAAGDIAAVPYGRAGETLRIEHWVVAEAQGQHAARAMLGNARPYVQIPFFWTRQYGHSIKYTGHAAHFDYVAFRGGLKDEGFFAGYFQEGKLKSAASLGGGSEFIALEELLKAGAPPDIPSFEDIGISFVERIKKLV
jgi:NADPH-dependent 2,4-dienoyl-CoA reductase/sulfur reductase-like enzyme/nitrite reductase/ring-hydroxylating ferredoxin subunit